MTESVNPTLSQIENAVEKFGLFALKEIGLTALFAAVPWLAVWPLGPIIRRASEILTEKLFAYLRLVIDLKVIRFVNEKNQAAFDREVTKLKAMARAFGTESPEFKTARENAKTSLSEFVRFRGV